MDTNNLEEMSFEVMLDDGTKKRVDVVLTFQSEDNRNFMVYTDNEQDDEGNLKTYASMYDEVENGVNLIPIENDKDWKLVELVLKEAQAEVLKDEQ